MKLNCFIRSIVDHKYMHYAFLPIIYNIIHSENSRFMWTVLLVVYLLWVFAFTCSFSGNLFTRVAEGLGIDLIAMFVSMLILSKYFNITNTIMLYILSGILGTIIKFGIINTLQLYLQKNHKYQQ